MSNPAGIDALAARWHPNPLDDSTAEAAARLRLDEAWRALKSELPSIEARLEAGTVDSDLVIDTIVAAALRVLRNPEGYVEGSAALDDYRESWKTGRQSNDLYFTAAELRRLVPIQRGAFTIRPGIA